MTKRALTGKAVLAGTGEGVAPGGRALADARLLALEGSKKGLLEASALGEAQAGGDA